LANKGIRQIDYYKTILEGRKFIAAFTLSAVIIAALMLAVTPKSYVSEGIIRLGEVDGKLVYEPEDAVNIIQSSDVLDPVAEKYFPNKGESTGKKLLENGISITLVNQRINIYETRVSSFLKVTANYDDAEKSNQISSSIIDNFLEYAKADFNKKKNIQIQEYNTLMKFAQIEYNESNDVALESYNEKTQGIRNEIAERKNDVATLNDYVARLESEIGSTEPKNMLPEEISKNLLLRSLSDGNRKMLIDERNVLLALENNLVMEKVNLKNTLTKNKITYEDKLANNTITLGDKMGNTRDFEVIKHPRTPDTNSSPNIIISLAVVFVVSLSLSVIITIYRSVLELV